MHQTSRYFTALTDAFLAEGGTIDKYIGDAVMVFWNAPHLQPDHVERACRAALKAKASGERLNRQFAAEGLPQFCPPVLACMSVRRWSEMSVRRSGRTRRCWATA
jgi:adenylate cyclase